MPHLKWQYNLVALALVKYEEKGAVVKKFTKYCSPFRRGVSSTPSLNCCNVSIRRQSSASTANPAKSCWSIASAASKNLAFRRSSRTRTAIRQSDGAEKLSIFQLLTL